MKTQNLLILFSILPIILIAQWYPQTSGTTENLSSIYFTDTENGWTVGNYGSILKTGDGGNNWEEQISGTSNNLLSVYFSNLNHGWAGGVTDDFPYFGLILRTVDGGNSWEELNSEVAAVQSIYFTDSLSGWLAAGNILHTTDGGETWQSILEPTNYMNARSICFTDSLNGWVSGGHGVGSTGYIYGYIWHTNDGGNNWENQFYYGEHDGTKLYSIYFVDSLNGWCTGGSWGFYGILLKTTNGGNDWDTSYYASYNSEELNSVYFTDLYNGWAVGQDGLIINTSDGGNNWDTISVGTGQYLNEIYFTESGHGWIAGAGGTILHADYSQIVSIDELGAQSLKSYLHCYPNPFSGSTTIEYELNQPGKTVIRIFTHTGKLIEMIQIHDRNTENKFIWDAKNLPSGIYFIQLQSGNEMVARKIFKL